MLFQATLHCARCARTRAGKLRLAGVPGLLGLFSITAATNVAVLAVNLGGGIAQARALGPDGRGELTVAMLWPYLIAGLGGLGMREAVAYRTAREGPGRSQVLATALAIGVAQTLVMALLAWMLLPAVLQGKPPRLLSETMFFLWVLPLFPLTFYPQGFFQGRMAMRAFNATLLSVSGTSTAILVVLWALHRLTVHTALAANLASWALTAALAFAILGTRSDWAWKPSMRLARPLLWFGIRQQIGSATVIVLEQRVDLLVLSLVVPAGALGTYAVAGSAGMVASSLPMGASFVLYPLFARQSEASFPSALARFLVIAGMLTMLAGPVFVVLLPLAVPYVFGPGFAQAAPLTALLSVGYLARGWNLMLSSVIQGAGRPFTASIGQAVEFVVLAGLLVALVPRMGVVGGALSVVLGAAVSFIVLLVAALFVGRLTPGRLVMVWISQIRRWRQRHSTSQRGRRAGVRDP